MSPAVFILIAVAFSTILAFDLRSTTRDTGKSGLLRAAAWGALAAACCGLLGLLRGGRWALSFAGAFLAELALSIDNVAAFVAVFAFLGLPRDARRRVLTWGLLGALVTRGALISVATFATRQWLAASAVLGAFLLFSAVWTVIASRRATPQSRVAPALMQWLHVARAPSSNALLVREDGHLRPTLILVAVVAVELTDLACSFDSVPTALAVTGDTLTLYASNILAVATLRALYVMFAAAPFQGRTMVWAAALLVGLAGAKLLASPWWAPTIVVTATVFGAAGAVLGVVALAGALRRRPPLTGGAIGAMAQVRKP